MTRVRLPTGWLMTDFGGTLEVIPPGPAWQYRAACADTDPDLFFPEGRGSSPAAALQVCAGCPVQVECRDWAIAEGLDDGIFGGMTPAQRAAHASSGGQQAA